MPPWTWRAMKVSTGMDTPLTQHDDSRPPAWRRSGALFGVAKRTIDIVGGLCGPVMVAPVIVLCAAIIKLADGGPVFYTQWRVGEDGWLFRIYKLRTMAQHAERSGEARFAERNDPRILPGCAWMRKTHVDELPQLWHIVRGEMSLVGPRPERPEKMEELRPWIPRIDDRLAGRPGLTGLAQIRNGYTNDIAGARRKVAYDLRYLRNRTLLGEIKLILRTVPRFWDRSAC